MKIIELTGIIQLMILDKREANEEKKFEQEENRRMID